MSKRISTCDNHSGTPRYVVEEKVRDIHVFTSIVIPGNVAKDHMSLFATVVRWLVPGKSFSMMSSWKMHSLAEH